MSDSIELAGPIAFMQSSGSAVSFTKSATNGGSFRTQGTSPQVRHIETALEVAYWGEDNRFPQNIEQQMAYYGVGKQALNWKANVLFGDGIVPGKITGIKDDGNEIFVPLDRTKFKDIYAFVENRTMFRFLIEYLQDWVWFGNCFPEVVLSRDCKTITHFIHQESCDARFKQMNDQGVIDTLYLSKMWGSSSSQFAKFDPSVSILGITENPRILTVVDKKLLKSIDCIDMYDQLGSLTKIADKLKAGSGDKLRSAILPVNYPSPNKTYYQVPAWDGARLAGWVEIACKIPAILKMFYKKGQKIQQHIEVPETYFEIKYTKEKWAGMDEKKKAEARKKLLKEMDEFLTSDKATFSTFVSFFNYDNHNKTEYGRIKFTPIDGKYNLDKEMLTSSAADMQFLTAIGVHPTLIGASSLSSGTQRTGGSDQREAFLIYCAQLKLEREVVLEPLYLARDFNGWDSDIVFRIRDIQLTTLDQNSGTVKKLS
jgi:hypothetical protein